MQSLNSQQQHIGAAIQILTLSGMPDLMSFRSIDLPSAGAAAAAGAGGGGGGGLSPPVGAGGAETIVYATTPGNVYRIRAQRFNSNNNNDEVEDSINQR